MSICCETTHSSLVIKAIGIEAARDAIIQNFPDGPESGDIKNLLSCYGYDSEYKSNGDLWITDNFYGDDNEDVLVVLAPFMEGAMIMESEMSFWKFEVKAGKLYYIPGSITWHDHAKKRVFKKGVKV